MTQWADYAGGRPSASALKAAGFGGVLRYVGLGGGASLPGKRITAAEYKDHIANGVQVLLVCEGSTTDAWGGYSAGVTNAQAALADARSLGVPDSVPIFAAADAHATPAQVAAAVDYARGFRAVLGLARTGFYGFQETVTAVRTASAASWFWRCGSQPTAAEKTWTHLWQRNTAPTTRIVSGVICDINEQYLPVGTAAEEDDLTPEESNRLKWCEQALRTLVNQVTGDPKGDPSFNANMTWVDGHFPGFPSFFDGTMHSLTDYARLADAHAYNAELNAKAALDAITANTTTISDDDLAKLAQAVLAALPTALARQIVDEEASRLAPKES